MPEDAPPLGSFEEATRELVAALRSADPRVREHALEEVPAVVDDALARELLRFARDAERGDEERGEALIALGPALSECHDEEAADGTLESPAPGTEDWWELPLSAAGYREVQDELHRIYHDAALPKLVRRRALEAAVRAPRDWHREAAATAWSSGDPEWRATAVFAMGHLQGFQDEVIEAFRGEDPALRGEAIRAAGRSATGEVLAEDLLALAADRTARRDHRLAAVEALGELQPEEASHVLAELQDDPDPEIAAAAREAAEGANLWSSLEEEGFGLPDDLDLDLDLSDLDDPNGPGEDDW